MAKFPKYLVFILLIVITYLVTPEKIRVCNQNKKEFKHSKWKLLLSR